MGKIRYTIRLYKAHDLDLITFAETHEFNIVKAIYSALVSFSKKEAFVIDIPPRKHKNFLNDKRVYVKTLTLDDKDDAKAIEILDKIKQGYRNNFLKNLLRQYLCNPISEEFLNDKSEMDYFYTMFSIFKEGKRIAKAGKVKKKRQKKELNSFFDSKIEKKNEILNEKQEIQTQTDDYEESNKYEKESKESDKYEENVEVIENNNDDKEITDLFSQILN